jgi:hypothetical protein
MRKLAAMLLLVFASSIGCFAQGPEHDESRRHFDVPPPVFLGLIAYRDKGLDAAVQAWIKDSAIEQHNEPLPQVDALRQAPRYYGVYRNFEFLGVQDLSMRVREVYLVMNYDRGPLFGRFLCFRSEDHGWVVLNFDFNIRPEAILPAQTTPLPQQPGQ